MTGDQQVGPGMYVKIGLNTEGMIGGIGGVSLALNQSLEVFSKFERVAQYFVDLANDAGEFGKKIKDNARDLGLSTDEFQRWTHAAITAGSSAEEITTSIRLMSVRMKDAMDPTTDIGKLLQDLGVNVVGTDGKMRSMNDILLDLMPTLNNLPTGFARNQASMTIFGRGFSNIADLTSLSRDELQKLMDQAPVFSDEKIKNLDDYHTTQALLNEKMERSKVLIGEELTPSFTTWTELISTSMEKGQPLFKFFETVNLGLEMAAEDFVILGDTAAATYNLITPGTSGFLNISEWDRAMSQMHMDVQNMKDKFAHPEWFKIMGTTNPLSKTIPITLTPPDSSATSTRSGTGTGTGSAAGTPLTSLDYGNYTALSQLSNDELLTLLSGASFYENATIKEYAPGISHGMQDKAIAQILANLRQRPVTINLTQNNTGVASDAEALNKVLGKIAAIGGALE